MLDVHALAITPGAALVLGNTGAIAGGGDGAQVAGVPVRPDAVLRMFGAGSIAANSIAAIRLRSQDMVDPINGITFTPGVASLLSQFFEYTTLPYKTGARELTMGTNVGVNAAMGFLIDEYKGGNATYPCIKGSRSMGGEVMTGAHTFGGALTANTWGTLAYAPGTALPNGRYAILGAYVSAITNGALIRFTHADFGNFKPGFPVSNYETISTSTWDECMKDPLNMMEAGQQFIYLSEILGNPCCPVFTVSNAGTGLTIEMCDAIADTPVVNLMLVKVA